jgi:hypothetical protein
VPLTEVSTFLTLQSVSQDTTPNRNSFLFN